MDPFDEIDDDQSVDVSSLKEHSDLWFWWREQTFFEDMWEHVVIFWNAFRPGIIGLSIIIGVLLFANHMDNIGEAETYEYREVADWTKDYPQIALQVETYLTDGVLTEGEYETIEEVVQAIETEQAIVNARSKVQKALQAQ